MEIKLVLDVDNQHVLFKSEEHIPYARGTLEYVNRKILHRVPSFYRFHFILIHRSRDSFFSRSFVRDIQEGELSASNFFKYSSYFLEKREFLTGLVIKSAYKYSKVPSFEILPREKSMFLQL